MYDRNQGNKIFFNNLGNFSSDDFISSSVNFNVLPSSLCMKFDSESKVNVECTKFIFQYEPESAMIFSLSVTSHSWVSRSRSKSASVEVRDRLTSLVMSGDCGAELRVSPAVREVEAENCTAVNSASLT